MSMRRGINFKSAYKPKKKKKKNNVRKRSHARATHMLIPSRKIRGHPLLDEFKM